MSRGSVLKGGAWLSAGNVLSAFFSFLRNVVVARLISVEDFGIVVMLSLIVSVIETISNLAIDRLLIQARDGDDQKLQATAHLLQVVRGMVGGLLMLLPATFLASIFKMPQAAWAFQMLALIPIIRGLAHLDTIRFQRDMHFKPTFWVIVLPSALSFVVAALLTHWLENYTSIVWAMLIQALVQTAITHVLAVRPYRWAWDVAVASRIMAFGWPLLVNGLLMFVIFQGDKAIVAVAFTPEVVGWYGAAFMLSMAPAMVVISVMQSLLLPLLSRAQNDPREFARYYDQTVQLHLGAGLVLATFTTVLGPELFTALFGAPYRAGTELVIALGLAQGVRVAKGGQFVCSVALAKTKYPLYGNLGRGVAFIGAVILAMLGFGPLTIATIGVLGEIISYFIAVKLLTRRGYPTDSWHILQLAIFISLVVVSLEIGNTLREVFPLVIYAGLALGWLVIVVAIYTLSSPAIRSRLYKSNANRG